MSRSRAFAVAVLRKMKFGLLDALRVVKKRHPDTMIHPALWESLCAFYQENVPFQSALSVMISIA